MGGSRARIALLVIGVLIGSSLVTAVAEIYLSRAEAHMIGALTIGATAIVLYRRGIRRSWWEGTAESVPAWIWALGAVAVALFFSSVTARDQSVRSTRLLGMVAAGTLGLSIAIWRGRERSIARRWAERRGLELGQEGLEVLRSYIRRAQLLRTAAVAAYGCMVLAGRLLNIEIHASWIILLTPVTILQTEIVVRELTYKSPRRAETSAASLTVRTVEQYAPKRPLRLVRLLGTATLLLVPAYALLPHSVGTHPTFTEFILIASLGAVIAIECEVAQRVRVRMAQPYVSDELQRLDEAIRKSWAQESLYGALAALAAAVAYEVWVIGDVVAIAGLGGLFQVVAIAGGLAVFLYSQIRAYEDLGGRGPR